ncbi:uncharacterized protein IWZ02DRAFT_418108 [Phyllosticta citriasiana]|uniref:[Histone H3]-lysine(27) N-trimethyltransferase n=1 Tax=Phyllosticta citriasiana TaxID=595635 RepID=A0ABR1KRF9_9PEZI
MDSTAQLCNLSRMRPIVEEVQRKFQDDARYFAADRLARARSRHVAKTTGPESEMRSDHPSKSLTSGSKHDSTQPTTRKSRFASLQPKAFLKKDNGLEKTNVKREYIHVGGDSWSIHSTVTNFASTCVQVPSYKSFVSLSPNILAPNNKNVLVLPCFSDDQHDATLVREMKVLFEMNNEKRDIEIDYVEKCWQLFPYAHYALEKVGCSFHDIINYYAMSKEQFKRILETNAQNNGLNSRQVAVMEIWKTHAFSNSPALRNLSDRLPRSTPDALARTSVLRQAWNKVFGIGLNFITLHHFKADQEFRKETGFEYRTLACRVCHVHECHYHGAMVEEDSDDPDMSLNIRTYITTGRRVQTSGNKLEYKSANYWKKLGPKTSGAYNRPSFVPCNHEGSCEQAQCTCFQHEVICEKSCGCSKSCPGRFSGCSCSKQQKTCLGNLKCQCFILSRECDPDLCSRCGAGELLSSVGGGRDSNDEKLCQNVKMQSGIKKLTILGTSSIKDAGFGLYAGEDMFADDYLGEYTGEIISHEEMLRREFYYDKQRLQYLFNLTGRDLEDGAVDQAIDATRIGNEMRFINNAKREYANCTVKILMCNTVHRIGVFATENIPAGKELFFDYGFDKEFVKNYGDPTNRRNSINSPHGTDDDDMPLIKSLAGRKRRWSEDRVSDDEYVDAESDED